MSTIGKFTLQSDENGLITLQCDRCKARFKMECSYLNDELKEDICCPICGIAEHFNKFFPEEIEERAKAVALNEAAEIIQQAFKGLNSKNFKVKTNPITKTDRNLVFKNTDYDMQQFELKCCNKKIALMPTDLTAGYYCPYCGRIVK